MRVTEILHALLLIAIKNNVVLIINSYGILMVFSVFLKISVFLERIPFDTNTNLYIFIINENFNEMLQVSSDSSWNLKCGVSKSCHRLFRYRN